MSLTIATAATGVARTAHYVVPTGQTQPIRTLLLEPQRTNLCIRSEEFDNAAWPNAGATKSANTVAAPDGATTGDTLTDAGVGAFNAIYQTVTFTGDGEKCVAIYLKAGTASITDVAVFDNTATAFRHRVRVTWNAGVATAASGAGGGTVYPVEELANGWYRILFSATSVVAANSNRIIIYPTGWNNEAAGTVYAWGAQAENAVVPSSYIKTEATTVTRNADSLYFPFTAPPQEMTVYLRGVNSGGYINQSSGCRTVHIGSSNQSTDPRFSLSRGAGSANMLTLYDDGVTLVTSSGAPPSTIVCGDIIEQRGVLRSNWSVVSAMSLNGSAEQVGNASAPAGAVSAWADQRIYLAGFSDSDQFAYTHVVVAAGEQTMDTMRQLAGVA